MSRLIFNLEALQHNLSIIDGWMEKHGAYWTLVTKVLCGNEKALSILNNMEVKSVGDSRFQNLEIIHKIMPETERWYLRPPSRSRINTIAKLCDVSLNSEIETIKKLNDAAKAINKIHRIVIMIELGDLREGILPGSLAKFYKDIFKLSNIEVIGIGANIGCLYGTIPTIDQFMQLMLYRELLELKFDRKLPLISAGSSAALPLVLDKSLPKAINHFRIGESVFLGTDLINGGQLKGLHDDVVILEAEITEIKEKSLMPTGETSNATMPFDVETNTDFQPGQRGYRALVEVGELDTDVSGLTPVEKNYSIAGASSDLTVVHVGDTMNDLKISDTIKFKLGYSALLRLMSNIYVEKVFQGEKGLDMSGEDHYADEFLPEIKTKHTTQDK